MTKYDFVVAYLNLFDGEIVQELFVATDEVDAANQKMGTTFSTMEDIQDYAANADSYINVYKV